MCDLKKLLPESFSVIALPFPVFWNSVPQAKGHLCNPKLGRLSAREIFSYKVNSSVIQVKYLISLQRHYVVKSFREECFAKQD